MVTDCEQTEQRLERKAVRSLQTSLDLDMLQARIKLLEDVVRAIANEREKLKIELNAPPRITVLQPADIPEGKDPPAR